MSNPIIPHDEPAPDVAETTGTAGTDGTKKRTIFRYRDMKSMPRGIEMQEYVHADGSLTFVGQYYNTKNAQPNSRPKRVYRVEVRKIAISDELIAAVFEDDVRLVKLGGGTSKWNLAYAALGALRGILHKRCTATRTNRKLKKLAKQGNPNIGNYIEKFHRELTAHMEGK